MKALLLQRVAGEPVQNLAQAFLSNSVAFIETLFTWMSEQYSELTQEKGKGLKPITGVSSVTQLLLSLKRYTLGENMEATAIPPDRCGIVSNATGWKES
jgi:hypothetical protein